MKNFLSDHGMENYNRELHQKYRWHADNLSRIEGHLQRGGRESRILEEVEIRLREREATVASCIQLFEYYMAYMTVGREEE